MAQKLFIGGLAFTTSTERLREVFTAAGQVESAAVVTDRETGRSRGFGFVEMATMEEADKAILQFNGKDVDGRQVRVEKASAGRATRRQVAQFRPGERVRRGARESQDVGSASLSSARHPAPRWTPRRRPRAYRPPRG